MLVAMLIKHIADMRWTIDAFNAYLKHCEKTDNDDVLEAKYLKRYQRVIAEDSEKMLVLSQGILNETCLKSVVGDDR